LATVLAHLTPLMKILLGKINLNSILQMNFLPFQRPNKKTMP
jgi:hypothetical protein